MSLARGLLASEFAADSAPISTRAHVSPALKRRLQLSKAALDIMSISTNVSRRRTVLAIRGPSARFRPGNELH
jgi:hypothetical protein